MAPDQPTRFWKIRHKLTGLFYKPSKYRSKANLSAKGKTYSKRPSLKMTCGVAMVDPDVQQPKWGNPILKSVPLSEMEIVEYVVIESATLPAMNQIVKVGDPENPKTGEEIRAYLIGLKPGERVVETAPSGLQGRRGTVYLGTGEHTKGDICVL
jgi:hypothetical protein